MPKRVHPSTLTYPYRAAQVRGGTAGRLRSPTGQLWSVASHYRLYHVVLIKLRLELCVRLTEHDLTMSSARTRACLQADLHRPAVASVTSGKMNLPPRRGSLVPHSLRYCTGVIKESMSVKTARSESVV
jgi:hypothetical protein